jgi:hypothetical protein
MELGLLAEVTGRRLETAVERAAETGETTGSGVSRSVEL